MGRAKQPPVTRPPELRQNLVNSKGQSLSRDTWDPHFRPEDVDPELHPIKPVVNKISKWAFAPEQEAIYEREVEERRQKARRARQKKGDSANKDKKDADEDDGSSDDDDAGRGEGSGSGNRNVGSASEEEGSNDKEEGDGAEPTNDRQRRDKEQIRRQEQQDHDLAMQLHEEGFGLRRRASKPRPSQNKTPASSSRGVSGRPPKATKSRAHKGVSVSQPSRRAHKSHKAKSTTDAAAATTLNNKSTAKNGIPGRRQRRRSSSASWVPSTGKDSDDDGSSDGTHRVGRPDSRVRAHSDMSDTIIVSAPNEAKHIDTPTASAAQCRSLTNDVDHESNPASMSSQQAFDAGQLSAVEIEGAWILYHMSRVSKERHSVLDHPSADELEAASALLEMHGMSSENDSAVGQFRSYNAGDMKVQEATLDTGDTWQRSEEPTQDHVTEEVVQEPTEDEEQVQKTSLQDHATHFGIARKRGQRKKDNHLERLTKRIPGAIPRPTSKASQESATRSALSTLANLKDTPESSFLTPSDPNSATTPSNSAVSKRGFDMSNVMRYNPASTYPSQPPVTQGRAFRGGSIQRQHDKSSQHGSNGQENGSQRDKTKRQGANHNNPFSQRRAPGGRMNDASAYNGRSVQRPYDEDRGYERDRGYDRDRGYERERGYKRERGYDQGRGYERDRGYDGGRDRNAADIYTPDYAKHSPQRAFGYGGIQKPYRRS